MTQWVEHVPFKIKTHIWEGKFIELHYSFANAKKEIEEVDKDDFKLIKGKIGMEKRSSVVLKFVHK